MAGAWNRRVAAIGAIGAVVLAVVTTGGSVAHGAQSHPFVAAKAPKGTKGSFSAVTTVPHSSDLLTIGYYTTSSYKTRYFEARRHHGHWQRMKPIKLGAAENGGALTTVTAGSSKTVWVGGDLPYKHSIQDVPAIWRLKGKKFVAQKLPDMENGEANIASISASSATDAWAVGVIYVLPGGSLCALHWNGTTWFPVAFPEPEYDATPISVSVSSPTNAWATDGSDLFQWNGKVWATNGTAPAGVELRSVATASPNLVYAVGDLQNPAGGFKTVIMRYNGATWSSAKLAPGTGKDELFSVAIHGRSAWAVGDRYNLTKDITTPVILHTNGGVWKNQKAPSKAFTLRSVSAASAKHAYAAGSYTHGHEISVTDTFLDFYNGHSWKGAPSKF